MQVMQDLQNIFKCGSTINKTVIVLEAKGKH